MNFVFLAALKKVAYSGPKFCFHLNFYYLATSCLLHSLFFYVSETCNCSVKCLERKIKVVLAQFSFKAFSN